MEIKNENSLRAISDNDYVLQRNGTDLVCPHIHAGMQKHTFPAPVGEKPKEQLIPTRTSCSTMCPLFQLNNDINNKLVAILSCGCSNVTRVISKVLTITEQMEVSKTNMKTVN